MTRFADDRVGMPAAKPLDGWRLETFHPKLNLNPRLL